MNMDSPNVQVVVNLDPLQLARLLEVKNLFPNESFDKTIGDVIEIALKRYAEIARAAKARGY